MPDRKSTRLNSSHLVISYAVFCLKKKKTIHKRRIDSRSRPSFETVTDGLSTQTFRRDTGMSESAAGTAALGRFLFFFFFNDTATTEIYTLSLHDALPI